MDPNVTLNEIRAMIGLFDAGDYSHTLHTDKLVDLIDGLDKWITNGGFLPDPWKEV